VVRALRHHRHLAVLPSSWAYYQPTFYDIGLFIGSFGLFFVMFLLFLRFVPAVAIAEVKLTLPEAHAGGDGGSH
jgi:hypothetical protein